jgi:hypothetical protein
MSGSNRLARLARLVPLAGVGFAVLTIAGYLTIGPFPDTDASVSELTSFYAAHHGQVAAGGQLLGLAARSSLPCSASPCGRGSVPPTCTRWWPVPRWSAPRWPR